MFKLLPNLCRAVHNLRKCQFIVAIAIVGLCLGVLPAAYATQLKVCHVDGEVYHNGVVIRVGSELSYTDDLELEFSSANDVVFVVSPEKGRYMISARKSRVVNGMVRVLVRENFMPCPLLKPTEKPDGDIKDLLNDGRLSMLDSIVLPLNTAYTDAHPNQYFLLRYNYEGQKIARKIAVDPASPYLKLSASLFQFSDQYVDPSDIQEMELYWYDPIQNATQKISDLKITSLLSESTVQELRVLVDGVRAYTNDDKAQLLQEVKSHIEAFYGQIGDVALERYLRMMAVK